MFRHLRLSYDLLRLANSVLDRRKEKFKKELENLDLNERVLEDTLDCLIGIKDHLVRKMCVHWLKKKSIILPEDLPKVETAKDLIKGNRGIDYLTFDSPVEIIEQFEEKAQIEFDKLIKPDSLPELYDKVDLGEGVTVYTVENTKEGQYAVRKLADSHFGEGFDNWCIIYRLRKEKDVERDDMGMMVKSFEEYWKGYNAYPKRLAFKDGRLFAFCANDAREILWWDQNDKHFEYIPKHKHLDDYFIYNYIYESDDFFETDVKRMSKFDIERVLESDETSIELKASAIEVAFHTDQESYIDNINDAVLLDELSKSNNTFIREKIAIHPHSSLETLVKLSKDEDVIVRSYVVRNPNISKELLFELSSDKDSYVRVTVSRLIKAPADILVKLSNDEDKFVRQSVAYHPNTPVDVLVKLSEGEVKEVYSAIACNSNTPSGILVKLSRSKDADIRYCVAKHLNTPESVLVQLSEDEDEWVRRTIAANSNAPESALIKLSEDEDSSVREKVAENPNTPKSALVALSEDEDEWVRRTIAQSPNTPDEILFKLSSNDRRTTGYYAIENLRSRGIDV